MSHALPHPIDKNLSFSFETPDQFRDRCVLLGANNQVMTRAIFRGARRHRPRGRGGVFRGARCRKWRPRGKGCKTAAAKKIGKVLLQGAKKVPKLVRKILSTRKG